MKLAKIVYLLAIGTALTLSSTGCRKGLDKTTQIPGRGTRSVTETPAEARNLNDGAPIVPTFDPNATGTRGTPLSPGSEGIPVADGETFAGWNENRDIFKDQTVFFEFDKSVVKASEIPKLEEVASKMKSGEFLGKALRIEGHCDERGTEDYNRALGDRRALSIREKLAELGVDPKVMPTISFGEERPLDPGHDDSAWSKNRRGELILLTRPGSN